MKNIHNKGKRILAVLLALLILLPVTAIFASADPLPATSLELEVNENYMSVEILTTFTPAFTELDGVPKFSISILDSNQERAKPNIDVYDNFSSIYINDLPVGEYSILISVIVDDAIYIATDTFEVKKYYPTAKNDLDIKALYDAVYEDCDFYSLNSFNYTISSWQNFEATWADSYDTLWRAVNGRRRLPSQDDINDATALLVSAFGALTLRANAGLNIDVLYEALYEDCYLYDYESYYTDDSWEAFSNAWHEAEELLDEVWNGDETITQGDIDAAAAALYTACEELEETEYADLNISVLEYAVYNACNIYNIDMWQYTTESWNNFSSTYWSARNMLNNIWYEYDEEIIYSSYTQNDIDEMVTRLYAAYNGLEKLTGTAKLFSTFKRIFMEIIGWIFEPFEFAFEWVIEPFDFLPYWVRQPFVGLDYIINHGL